MATSVRSVSVSAALALVVIFGTSITAFAAMDATLSSDHARPGDAVLILTEDHNGTWRYEGLSEENHQKIYLAPTTITTSAEACGGLGSAVVGTLTWRGNAAGVAFIAPNVAAGDYWVFMETYGQCWRIAGVAGLLLVISIGSIPADNQAAAGGWTVESLPPLSQPSSLPRKAAASASPGNPLRWIWPLLGIVLLALVFGVGLKTRSDRGRNSESGSAPP